MRWMILCLALNTVCSAAPPSDLVKAQLLAETRSIQPGMPFRVAVDLTIEPGWHIYWINPGEGGLPTKATLTLPAGLTASEFKFPTPKTFDLPGGLTAYGYEDHVTLLATVTSANNYAATSTTIDCQASWLVCKELCVAGKASPTITLPLGTGEIDHRDLFDQAERAMPVTIAQAPGVEDITSGISLHPDGKAGQLAVKIPWHTAAPVDLEFFPPPAEGLAFGKPVVNSGNHVTTITTDFDVLAGQKLPTAGLDSVLRWKLNDQTVGVRLPVHFESATPSVK